MSSRVRPLLAATRRGRNRRLRAEPLEPRLVLDTGSLLISEFMAVNDSVLADQDGTFSDWVEIHNPAPDAVQLDGWHLTDDDSNPTRWQFPAVTIDSGGYLVVFASGKDRVVDELHTSFKLSSGGEYLGLVKPDGTTVSSQYAPEYPAQVADVSYGWSADHSTQGYFTRPTPGEPNDVAPVDDPTRQIVVGEIMYRPAGDDVLDEYVELFNQGVESVRLSGWRLATAVDFTFPDVMLDANEYLVVAADVAAFTARYPDVANVVGGWTGDLDDDGETIELLDAAGERIDRVDYGSSGSWPGRADGKGSSLQIRDAIELVNTTGRAIDLGGWYLSDSSNDYFKFQIPAGTVFGAGQYLAFDESDFNPMPLQPEPNQFALDGAHGDDVWLLAADSNGNPTRFVDHVSFGAARNGESFGRWPDAAGDLYPMRSRTLGDRNSGPRVGPLLISEVMYHPPEVGGDVDVDGDDLEFVEIYNASDATVDLTDWRIRKGVDYDFAAGTALAPRSVLVVARFDPQDPANAAVRSQFLAHYQLDASVQLVGGYSGKLDNGGEKIRLRRPDAPPQDEPDYVPRLLEDEVDYEDETPWPVEADGDGSSLHRLATDAWGNDPASWTAGEPTPGLTPFSTTMAPDIQSLGPVTRLQLNGLDSSDGDLWYGFETTREGLVTLETSDAGASLVLYDEDYKELTTSTTVAGRQRIDHPAGAPGETYYFKLAGGSDDVDLRLANLVHRVGSSVTVHGTTGDDHFEFRAVESRQITINQIRYDFDGAEVTSVVFDGLAGSDAATLLGTEEDETAEVWPDHAVLRGDGYEVTVENVASTITDGLGGDDEVTLYDSQDDDLLVTWPQGASMSGPTARAEVNGFERIYALATAGGNDAAKMFDSPGDDTFAADASAAAMFGEGFFNRSKFFEKTHAHSTAGGNDVAFLYEASLDAGLTERPLQGPDTEFSRVAWLYEFEVCFSEDRSSGRGPVEEAVDRVLTAYWP